MTCIVGLVADGRVHIAGDSAGISGLDLTVRADRKVFTNGEFIFGCTTSFRMTQLLRYALVPPKRHADVDVMRFMCTDFIDAVRNCLKNGGYARRDSDVESAGTFLVGYAGRLFSVFSDYQVGEANTAYEACGCGEGYAKGAMFANSSLPPVERLTQALAAAEAHSAGVRGPFCFESI